MKQRRHRRTSRSRRLVEEVGAWASKLRLDPECVYVQHMKKKWASCTPSGRVYFSSDLTEQPPRFRDFVIVHELLHLRIQNHGKLFRSLLSSFVPGWEREVEGKANRICR